MSKQNVPVAPIYHQKHCGVDRSARIAWSDINSHKRHSHFKAITLAIEKLCRELLIKQRIFCTNLRK